MLLCFLPNWSFAGGTSCIFSIVLFASHHRRVFPSLEIGLKCTLTVPLTTENWSLSTRRMSSNPAALTAASAFQKYLSFDSGFQSNLISRPPPQSLSFSA